MNSKNDLQKERRTVLIFSSLIIILPILSSLLHYSVIDVLVAGVLVISTLVSILLHKLTLDVFRIITAKGKLSNLLKFRADGLTKIFQFKNFLSSQKQEEALGDLYELKEILELEGKTPQEIRKEIFKAKVSILLYEYKNWLISKFNRLIKSKTAS